VNPSSNIEIIHPTLVTRFGALYGAQQNLVNQPY